jgi:hypothetical protein
MRRWGEGKASGARTLLFFFFLVSRAANRFALTVALMIGSVGGRVGRSAVGSRENGGA